MNRAHLGVRLEIIDIWYSRRSFRRSDWVTPVGFPNVTNVKPDTSYRLSVLFFYEVKMKLIEVISKFSMGYYESGLLFGVLITLPIKVRLPFRTRFHQPDTSFSARSLSSQTSAEFLCPRPSSRLFEHQSRALDSFIYGSEKSDL